MMLCGYHIQAVSYFLALLVYAVFGSPTPDSFGIPEAGLALLLLGAVRFEDVNENRLLYASLVYGLSIPVVMGVIYGQNIQDMVRDIIPFLFLFSPLFYGWIVKLYPREFLFSVGMIGLLFSVRTIWGYHDIVLFPRLWGKGPPADLLYLANSPEVLLTALLCLGFGGVSLALTRQTFQGLLLLFLSGTAFLAMALMMQRAGLGLYLGVAIIWLMVLVYYVPKRALLLGVVALAGVILLLPVLEILFETLLQKTEMVGLNSRTQEWGAVWGIVSHSTVDFLFGQGWGARLENPAVGGLSVNYTHSLFSSLLLKTGLLGGLVILSAVLGPVIRAIRGCVWQQSRGVILLGAVLPPFFISAGLYASYKSLGFGLVLMVFIIFSMRNLEKNWKVVQ